MKPAAKRIVLDAPVTVACCVDESMLFTTLLVWTKKV